MRKRRIFLVLVYDIKSVESFIKIISQAISKRNNILKLSNLLVFFLYHNAYFSFSLRILQNVHLRNKTETILFLNMFIKKIVVDYPR